MPHKDIPTSTLLQCLFKTSGIAGFISRHREQISIAPFHVYINQICASKDTVPERIILKSGIERTYGHQIFNGTRKPSRDKVIQLAFGFQMDYNEAQKLLRAARKSALYPKIGRDAVIIYALHKRLTVDAVQETLRELGLQVLGREDKYE